MFGQQMIPLSCPVVVVVGRIVVRHHLPLVRIQVVSVNVTQFVLAAIKQTNTMTRCKETAINTVFSTSEVRTQICHKVTQLLHVKEMQGSPSTEKQKGKNEYRTPTSSDDLANFR
jgi:hypothetical protein